MSESGTHALSVLKISLSGNSGYSQRNCDDFSTISLVHNSKRYSALFIYILFLGELFCDVWDLQLTVCIYFILPLRDTLLMRFKFDTLLSYILAIV